MTRLIKPVNITAYTALLTSISALSAQASAMNTPDGYYCRVPPQGFLQGILGNGDMMTLILVSILVGAALSSPIYVLIARRLNRHDNGGGSNAS